MRDLSVAVRAPLLGMALGAVGGGFEAIKLGATLKLALDPGQALALGAVTVGLGLVLGFVLGIPAGLVATVVTRGPMQSRRHAIGLALTGVLLGLWYLVPAAQELLSQDRLPAAIGFLLAPIGIGGVVYFNAAYWLRREELGEDRRFGWLLAGPLLGLLMAGGAAGALSTKSFGGAQALDTDPGVILITIDTLRQDHVSAWHDDPATAPVQTPVLDALAADGVRFADAVTPFPETAPAHSAMFTGLHPFRTGMLSNGHVLSPGYPTIAEVLSDEGYATAAFVSSFAVDSRTGLDQGFQVYDDELFPWVRGVSEIRLVRVATRVLMRFGDPLKFDFLLERPAPVTYGLALDWLADNGDRPFFLWVHSFDVHSPYEPHGLPGFEDNGAPGAPSVDHRHILANEAGYTYTDPVRAQLRRLYAEEVAFTDAELGRFLDAVDALQLDRDVLLIVTSDHGEMLGEHGIEMNHHGVYDPAVRVPLIIRPIRVSGSRKVVDEQVRLMDLPATILGQLGLDADRMGKTESIDLAAYIDLPNQIGASSMLMGRKTASLSQGTVYGYRANLRRRSAEGEVSQDRGRLKYILDPDEGTERLFDLDRDPAESADMAGAQQDLVEQMRTQVLTETGMRTTDEGGTLRFQRSAVEREHSQQVSPDEQRRLEALGYVQGEEETP
ncbi:MAG: sulfatase-like hydrolase/transferase [Alphaproteobacteria bacterium]|nr:sulfatase-like hydrolase/transferase [Alphaproteobacteria bacterium]